MEQPTITLHIGTHKTGTTSLQSLLGNSTDELLRQGILYPHAGRVPRHAPAHHNIAWEISGDSRHDSRWGTIDNLLEELRSHGRNALLSSEDFVTATYASHRFAEFVEQLRDVGYRLKLILVLRNQADYAASLYLTLLDYGLTMDFRSYLREIRDRGEFCFLHWRIPFDYQACIEHLASLPAELRVLSYDQLAAGELSMVDYLGRFGVDARGLSVCELPQLNTRRPLWLDMRMLFRNRHGVPTGSHESLFRILETLIPDCQQYQREERVALDTAFRQGNEAVEARWGIRLDSLQPNAPEPQAAEYCLSDLFHAEFHQLLADLGDRSPLTKLQQLCRALMRGQFRGGRPL